MSDDELTSRVIGVIAATQHIARETITPDKTFQELGIDSLDGINILFAVENEFNISIPDDAAKAIRSVGEMIEGISKLLAASGSSNPAAAQA
jgi:acyl carrier protein